MDEILEQLRKDARGIINTTDHYMKLAEKYMAAGEIAWAKACLLLLCQKCGNYEESIEFNGHTEKWLAYRYLVEGEVPPSVKIHSAAPCTPAECTVNIDAVFSLPDDDLLSALSDHLGQLSGQGEALNCLNKWERIVYHVDELWREVNSGGFSGYLYYYGTHAKKAYAALETIHANGVLQMLDGVQQKFPKGRIPRSEEAIQNTIDSMEDGGIDFDKEDSLFYSVGETELQKCLLAYVKENQRRFR